MAISGSDLLEENGGELLPELFAGLSAGPIEDLLDGYVADGAAQAAAVTPALSEAEQDTAARQYGYYRAKDRRLQQLAGTGSASVSLAGQFATQKTGDQFKELRLQADRHLKAFRVLVPEPTPAAASSAEAPPASRSVRHDTSW